MKLYKSGLLKYVITSFCLLATITFAGYSFHLKPVSSQPAQKNTDLEKDDSELDLSLGLQRDLVRVKNKEPWLRIDPKGHYASVQALAFHPNTGKLYSAGVDKNVLIWNINTNFRDLVRKKVRERAIRWQVARGLRGSIYAMDISKDGKQLAIGGYGAMGSLGEILIFDPITGTLKDVLQEHRQSITCLHFSENSQSLISSDASGKVVYWKQGDDKWTGKTLLDSDSKHYGKEIADKIAKLPKTRPVAILKNKFALTPIYKGQSENGWPVWEVQAIDLETFKSISIETDSFFGVITDISTSEKTNSFAACDLSQQVIIRNVEKEKSPIRIKIGKPVRSISLSSDGKHLAVGTFPFGEDKSARLQIWETASKKLLRERTVPLRVDSVAIGPNDKSVAFTGGTRHEVFLESLLDGTSNTTFQGKSQRIKEIRFGKETPFYKLLVVSQGNEPDKDLYEEFDLETRSRKTLTKDTPDEDWIKARLSAGDWNIKLSSKKSIQLIKSDQNQGTITLDPKTEGNIRSLCFILGEDKQPIALAVGTDLQNAIYIYQLADQGECTLLRHLRGHFDAVTSLCQSPDFKYLASASLDGSIITWSLEELLQGQANYGRWGVELNVLNNKAVVNKTLKAGPLYRKGMRLGDQITAINWINPAGETKTVKDANEITKSLQSIPWKTQVGFEYQRGAVRRKSFQLLPAWQPFVSLFLANDREWALWTPEGYYDASVNGHTLFGWQINRGLRAPVEYYRADQFQAKLERPDVIKNLLSAGSLPDAFVKTNQEAPAAIEAVLSSQIAQAPLVEILTPTSGTSVTEAFANVKAKIKVPQGTELTRSQVYANGVYAPNSKVIEQKEIPGGKEITIEWQAPLPTDKQNLIQVQAANSQSIGSFGRVLVNRSNSKPNEESPKLYIISVGIDKYKDSLIQPLNYSVNDARAIVEQFEKHASNIYQISKPTILTNETVTRNSWNSQFAAISKQLKEKVKPNDVLVLFFAGHGFLSPKTNEYFYASYDLAFKDYLDGQFSNCISWKDFAPIREIPCRKIAFLDTCHSGAIQPASNEQVKSAVRKLQENVILTVTASTGDEKAAEHPAWEHGAFTQAMLQALEGKADDDKNGDVLFDEVIDYVKNAVPKMTNDGQHPTAAPSELLPYISLKLSSPK